MSRRSIIYLFFLSFVASPAYSCAKVDDFYLDPALPLYDTLTVMEVCTPPYNDWSLTDRIKVDLFAPLSFSHQSAAVYGDYAFFVTNGRSEMGLYSLKKKEMLFTLALKGASGKVYHCNQCTFGFEKYDQKDFFPLLYISQRAESDGRCSIEAYRIFPLFNEALSEFESFSVEQVQTIFLPSMSYENSLGNANCVIDQASKTMYTYSRNNDSQDDNSGQCKITRFSVPTVYEERVVLEDEDILSSFMIDASAYNMQGGCIQDGILYIGQGYYSVGYIYLNIIDLERQQLIRRIDLQAYQVSWEPEGCFFYDGSVMLSHTSAISRIDK